MLRSVNRNFSYEFLQFGRAWIPEEKTRDISTHHSKLSIKATQGWRKARKELQTYLGYTSRSVFLVFFLLEWRQYHVVD